MGAAGVRLDLNDKRVLVTGSSRGIGLAAARVFLEAGARVAVNGSSDASTAAGVAELGSSQALVSAPGDVRTADGCRRVVGNAVDALGGLDVLVNSAGVGGHGPMESVTESDWDRLIDINLKGTFFCCQAAVPALRDAGGSIVNVGSDAGLIGEVGLAPYCASKGGVVNLTRALALELAPDIRVNCVCPGYVDTDMVRRDGIERAADPAAREQAIIDYAPLKRMASPQEIGFAIAYLASAHARFMTGAALPIDGGTTVGRG